MQCTLNKIASKHITEDTIFLKLRRTCKTLAYMKKFPCYICFDIIKSMAIN